MYVCVYICLLIVICNLFDYFFQGSQEKKCSYAVKFAIVSDLLLAQQSSLCCIPYSEGYIYPKYLPSAFGA